MKKFLLVGLVVLSTGAAISATADDGRYDQIKAVFEEAEGLRIESALASVTPYSAGMYEFRGTCFEPDGETWNRYIMVDLLATPSADPGVGDFFAEEELSAVEINARRYEFDREKKTYVHQGILVFKVVERSGKNYLLEELRSSDGAVYCVSAIE